jgi:hypothetical protein
VSEQPPPTNPLGIPAGDPSSDEYLAGAKRAALAYADKGDDISAVASMAASMRWRAQHEGTSGMTIDGLTAVAIGYVFEGDSNGVRRWISGWR